jgi:hypothetical protein
MPERVLSLIVALFKSWEISTGKTSADTDAVASFPDGVADGGRVVTGRVVTGRVVTGRVVTGKVDERTGIVAACDADVRGHLE